MRKVLVVLTMDLQEMLRRVDELVFSNTGKHLDSLQVTILKGVFKGQKYSQVAKDYNCTIGHVKDEAYELWRILSKALGEDLNKSNVRAAVERLEPVKAAPGQLNPQDESSRHQR